MKTYRLLALTLAQMFALTGCGTPTGSTVPDVSPASVSETAAPDPAPEPSTAPTIDYDVAGLYLLVLEELWDTDAGLNGGITYISVDLSNAPVTLSDEEVTALAETFAAAHQAMPLTLGYQELLEGGYFTETDGGWEEGLLLAIKESDGSGHTPADMVFDAEKWRGMDGADFYFGCTPIWFEDGACKGFDYGSYAIA